MEKINYKGVQISIMKLKDVKEEISRLPDEALKNSLKLKREEFQEGVYDLYLEEAIKRNVEIESSEDNISQNIEIASIFQRMVNYIIDYGIICVLLRILFSGPVSNNTISPVFAILIFLPISFLYFIILEYKYGKTLGKIISKTIVLTDSGEKPTLKMILIRTISRLIPFNGLITFFSGISIHDRVSKVKCYKERR